MIALGALAQAYRQDDDDQSAAAIEDLRRQLSRTVTTERGTTIRVAGEVVIRVHDSLRCGAAAYCSDKTLAGHLERVATRLLRRLPDA